MQSFGYANVGSTLIRHCDQAHFHVLTLMGDRLYVQRTLRVHRFESWYRPATGGRLAGIEYRSIVVGEKLLSSDHSSARFVVTAKDDERHEIIVVEGIIATDPTAWDLAIPQ